jgi:hypothetical protein
MMARNASEQPVLRSQGYGAAEDRLFGELPQ